MDEKEKTNQHFTEQWGKRFSSLDNFKIKNFEMQLMNLTFTLPKEWQGKKVFDAGCGNGRYTLGALHLLINSITAVDISEGGVNATIRNTHKFQTCIEDIYQASLTNLDKEIDNDYDIVFSINCIPHISNYKDALRELVRICKPGGLVLFNVPPVRPKLVSEVDGKIREHTTKMCPDCLMEFSKIMVYWANKPEISQALQGKMELSGDLLSAFDHFGLPLTQEFSQEQIIKDLKELNCEILKIDERISIKVRKK